MITTLNRHGLVLWSDVIYASIYPVFFAMGDHGHYCPVKFERL